MPKKNSDHHPDDDATGDPVADFADRLRELRVQAGSPSFRQLSKITNYSSSALAEVTSGKRLPSEAILKAFVTGCGADSSEWLTLLRKTAKAASAPAPTAPTSAGSAEQAAPRRAWGRSIMIFGGACALLAAGVVLGATIQDSIGAAPAKVSTNPAATRTSVRRAAEGAGPAAPACVPDARLVDKSPVMLNGRQIGALELFYSDRCAVGWARIYLYPGEPTMLGEVTVKASDGRLAAFAKPLIKQVSVYTNVIAPASGECLEAYAVFHPPAHSPVSVAIPCQALSLSCSGYSCHGHDPYTYHCGDDTNKTAGAYSGSAELAVLINEYGHCNANWSVGSLTPAGLSAHDTIAIDVGTTDSRGNIEFMCEPNIYGRKNTGNPIEECIGGSSTTCTQASTSAYGDSLATWTDMVDASGLTYSDLCVFHGTTLVATAHTRQ